MYKSKHKMYITQTTQMSFKIVHRHKTTKPVCVLQCWCVFDSQKEIIVATIFQTASGRRKAARPAQKYENFNHEWRTLAHDFTPKISVFVRKIRVWNS